MTFDDYILKQDHVEINYWGYKNPVKRVLSLDGVDFKDVCYIQYYKYDSKENKLLWHRLDGPAIVWYDEDGERVEVTDPRLNLKPKVLVPISIILEDALSVLE